MLIIEGKKKREVQYSLLLPMVPVVYKKDAVLRVSQTGMAAEIPPRWFLESDGKSLGRERRHLVRGRRSNSCSRSRRWSNSWRWLPPGRRARRRDFRLRRGKKGSDLELISSLPARTIVLLNDIAQILIGGYRNKRVEIFRRKLASKTHSRSVQIFQLLQQLWEGNWAVHGKDAGLSTGVTELAVRVTGEDLAAIAAEEFDNRGVRVRFNGDFDHSCCSA